MRAVIGRGSIRKAGLQWIIAVEKEPESALFVQRVRPGIGSSDLQPMTQTLSYPENKGIVVGDAFTFVKNGTVRKAQIWSPQIGVPTIECANGFRGNHIKTIGSRFTIDGIRRC